MSNNCVIRKLGVTVDNDNLPKLGVIRFEIPEGNNNRTISIQTGSSKTITLKSVNNRPFTVSGVSYTEKELSYSPTITLDSGHYVFEVSNKYNIVVFNIHQTFYAYNVDLEDFIYCPLVSITNISNKGNISVLKDITTLKEIMFYGSQVIGVIGDISVLGKLNQLSRLNVHASGITGTVEDFVAAQYDEGERHSCLTGIQLSASLQRNITFKGRNNPTFENNILTWESKTKIAVYAGAQTIADCTKVFVSGYTAEEIAEKTASGGDWEDKTVINVDEE